MLDFFQLKLKQPYFHNILGVKDFCSMKTLKAYFWKCFHCYNNDSFADECYSSACKNKIGPTKISNMGQANCSVTVQSLFSTLKYIRYAKIKILCARISNIKILASYVIFNENEKTLGVYEYGHYSL